MKTCISNPFFFVLHIVVLTVPACALRLQKEGPDALTHSYLDLEVGDRQGNARKHPPHSAQHSTRPHNVREHPSSKTNIIIVSCEGAFDERRLPFHPIQLIVYKLMSTIPDSQIFVVHPANITEDEDAFADPVKAFPSVNLAPNSNSQVFVLKGGCLDQSRYMKWAVKMRTMPKAEVSLFRIPPPKNFPEMFVTEALFVGNQTVIHPLSVQVNGSTIIRPVITNLLGETFWGDQWFEQDNLCKDTDILFHRSKTFMNLNCLTIWWAEGALRSKISQDYDLTRLNEPLSYDAALAKTKRKDKNKSCAMILTSVWKKFYYPDALVRHAFAKLLDEASEHGCAYGGGMTAQYAGYKNTIKADGAWMSAEKAFRPYKFGVAMENQMDHGYVSEKIFNVLLADSIPIYFGAPDVEKYINADRFVNCKVKEDVITDMRQYKEHQKFVAGKQDLGPEPNPAELISWAVGKLRKDLKPCVDRVIEIANDDEAYARMLSQPVFKTPLQKAFSKQELWANALRHALHMMGADFAVVGVSPL